MQINTDDQVIPVLVRIGHTTTTAYLDHSSEVRRENDTICKIHKSKTITTDKYKTTTTNSVATLHHYTQTPRPQSSTPTLTTSMTHNTNFIHPSTYNHLMDHTAQHKQSTTNNDNKAHSCNGPLYLPTNSKQHLPSTPQRNGTTLGGQPM